WIEIPDQVREVYRIWRPSPLYRADRLEKALDTPAHIYYKYEGVSPAGSHKPNTAVPQAYYNAQEGVKRLTTETGAGQWGSALAFAGEYPDVVIACVGGGSNFAGLSYPCIGDKRKGRNPNPRFIAAEPAACPTLTRGVYAYDFGDAVGMGPVVKMFTLGHSFIP